MLLCNLLRLQKHYPILAGAISSYSEEPVDVFSLIVVLIFCYSPQNVQNIVSIRFFFDLYDSSIRIFIHSPTTLSFKAMMDPPC